MERLKECKCRSENGNCTMTGGFCTSVPQNYCDMAKELKEYKDLEEQGKLLKLPCKTVWFICDGKTKYATVMSKSIRDLSIYEIEGIDKQGYYWSTRDKALVELEKISK